MQRCRVVETWRPFFSAIIPLTTDNSTADCVHNKVVNVMTECGITDRQLVGFGSHSASVMTGHLSDVGAQLKCQQPALGRVHCVAHPDALVTKDAT